MFLGEEGAGRDLWGTCVRAVWILGIRALGSSEVDSTCHSVAVWPWTCFLLSLSVPCFHLPEGGAGGRAFSTNLQSVRPRGLHHGEAGFAAALGLTGCLLPGPAESH
jgi:hypothetical protein